MSSYVKARIDNKAPRSDKGQEKVSGGLPVWAKVAAVALLFPLISELSLSMMVLPEKIAVIWPPGGFLLGALVLFPPRYWGWIILAIFPLDLAINTGVGRPLPLNLAYFSANAIEAVLGAALVVRFAKGRRGLSTLTELLYFILLAVVLIPLLTSLIGAHATVTWGGAPSFLDVYRLWFSSAGLGILFVAPLLIVWLGNGLQAALSGLRARPLEFTGLFFITLLVTVFVFWGGAREATANFVLLYVIFPLLMWGAIRFERMGATLLSIVLSLIGIWFTSRGHGPFASAGATTAQNVLNLQTFLAVAAVTALAVGILVYQQRRNAEQMAKLSLTVEQSPSSVVITDLDGNIEYVNSQFTRITGYTADEVLGQNAGILDSGQTPRAVQEELWDTIRRGKSWEGEFINRRKNGEVFVERAKVSPIRQSDGRVTQYLGIKEDITELKHTEEVLRRSEQNYREIFNATGDAILIHSTESGEICDVNRAMTEMFGYSHEEALMLSINDLSSGEPPYSQIEAVQRLQQAIKEGPQLFTWRSRRRNGDLFWSEVALRNSEIGGERRILAVVRDVDARVRAEEALQESEARYRLLVENQSDLVVKVDIEGRFQFVSPSYCRIFGKSEEELLGHSFLPLVHEDDQETTSEAMEQLYRPPYTCYLEQRAMTKDGWRWLGWADQSVLDEEGEVIAVVGVGRDITERKQVEEALHESELHLKNLDRISSLVTQNKDLHQILNLLVDELLDIFEVDRAWLIHPCDPQADFWEIPVAATQPEYENHFTAQQKVPMDPVVAEIFAGALASPVPIVHYSADQGAETEFARRYALESQMLAVMHPGLGSPWLLALHQCSSRRPWSENERKTFGDIARRVGDALTKYLLVGKLEQELEQRKRIERSLFEEKERAQVTLHSIGDAVISTDAKGHVQFLNQVAETLTGWNLVEAKGLRLGQVFNIVNEDTGRQALDPVSRCLHEGKVIGLANHTVLVSRTGKEIAIQDSAAPIKDRNGQVIGVVLVFSDVTEARRLSQEMSYQASHDSLTGLINRRELEYRLERVLKTSRTEHIENAFCYMDLDQFKLVNDTSGHVAGDELLKQVSQLLQNSVRHRDTLARLGGDEFGLLMEHCTLDEALRVARQLSRTVQEFRFLWGDTKFSIGISIGVVAVNAESGGLSSVLSDADAACYLAKDEGRNRIHVHHEDNVQLAKRRGEMHWAVFLPHALEENRLRLYCQEIIPVQKGRDDKEHYELLLRIEDYDGNIILPGVFLPAAERYNLASQIDRWVVNAAFSWFEQNPERLSRLDICTINLSGATLSNDAFLEFVIGRFKTLDIPSEKICFEITETVAIANLTNATRFITDLKDLGCRFALDDFGSGLSSFAYLKNLPVDFLKIDGMFVKNILDDSMDLAMVKSINEIGHVMGKQTIAEFVENDEILEKLREIGVDYAQGYGISKPRPLTAKCQGVKS